jgi:hypothetical protein
MTNQTLTLITLLPQIAVAQSGSAGVHSLSLEHFHDNVIFQKLASEITFG